MLFGFGCSLCYFTLCFYLILQNGISEYFLEWIWCYNFIAVNYLIYTNEVTSWNYPVIPLFSALFALAGFITYFIVQNQNYIENIPSYTQKLKYQESISYFCVLHCLLYLIYQRKKTREMYLMSYKPTAFINFILLSCTANWLLQILQNDTSSEAFSQLKQQILLQRIVLCETSKCSCWTT
jgi:hypothetical protein